MRLGVLCLGLLAAVAADAQRNRKDNTGPTRRACGTSDCILEREIRDFEVISQTHLIVYAGPERCAFHIELRGALCDLSFAPELYFSATNEIPDGGPPLSGEGVGRGPLDPIDSFETAGRDNRDLRICPGDTAIQVHGGRFTESGANDLPPDRFGNPRTDCRVSTVRPITDDQLVEFYVSRRVLPPLPPMGTGEIEVGEQEEEGDRDDRASEGSDAAP
jgi:hypothetical protein